MTETKATRPSEGAGRHDLPTIDNPDYSGDAIAEHAAAGAALVAGTPALTGEILATVDDDDFADPFCRFVITAVRRMHSERLPVDVVTVVDYVHRLGLLKPGLTRTHLGSRLFALANEAPIPMSGTYYALIVREQAVCRRVVHIAQRLAAFAFGGPESLSEAAPAIARDLAAAVARIERQRPRQVVAA